MHRIWHIDSKLNSNLFEENEQFYERKGDIAECSFVFISSEY